MINSMEDAVQWIENLSEKEQMLFWENLVLKKINIDKYEIEYLLNEIKYPHEYSMLFFYANSYIMLFSHKPTTYGTSSSDLKKKIANAKERSIQDLKFLYENSTLKYNPLLLNEITQGFNDADFDKNTYEVNHKETALKSVKNSLLNDLITHSKTSKKRAYKIVKILDNI
jgi:hypothetical protein